MRSTSGSSWFKGTNFTYTLHPALRKRNVKKIRRAERGSETKKTTRATRRREVGMWATSRG